MSRLSIAMDNTLTSIILILSESLARDFSFRYVTPQLCGMMPEFGSNVNLKEITEWWMGLLLNPFQQILDLVLSLSIWLLDNVFSSLLSGNIIIGLIVVVSCHVCNQESWSLAQENSKVTFLLSLLLSGLLVHPSLFVLGKINESKPRCVLIWFHCLDGKGFKISWRRVDVVKMTRRTKEFVTVFLRMVCAYITSIVSNCGPQPQLRSQYCCCGKVASSTFLSQFSALQRNRNINLKP